MKMQIRKGDVVAVISGNDTGKRGRVISALPREGRIVVEGVNMRKKHVRARRQGQKGEVVSVPLPIPASRALFYCGSCKRGVRTSARVDTVGKKSRACKKCGAGFS